MKKISILIIVFCLIVIGECFAASYLLDPNQNVVSDQDKTFKVLIIGREDFTTSISDIDGDNSNLQNAINNAKQNITDWQNMIKLNNSIRKEVIVKFSIDPNSSMRLGD